MVLNVNASIKCFSLIHGYLSQMPCAIRNSDHITKHRFPIHQRCRGMVTLQKALSVTDGDTSKGSITHSDMELRHFKGSSSSTKYVKWGTSLKEGGLGQGGTKSHMTC